MEGGGEVEGGLSDEYFSFSLALFAHDLVERQSTCLLVFFLFVENLFIF